MRNPPHPGEFIREIYITPFELSMRKIAKGKSTPYSATGVLTYPPVGAAEHRSENRMKHASV